MEKKSSHSANCAMEERKFLVIEQQVLIFDTYLKVCRAEVDAADHTLPTPALFNAPSPEKIIGAPQPTPPPKTIGADFNLACILRFWSNSNSKSQILTMFEVHN